MHRKSQGLSAAADCVLHCERHVHAPNIISIVDIDHCLGIMIGMKGI